MDHFPIFMKLAGEPCLVVGGCDAAERKVDLLRRAGAAVTVVAPSLVAPLAALAEAGDIVWVPRGFAPEDLDGVRLVIAAGEDEASLARISALARDRGLPVNVVDRPHLCSWITPTIVDRSPVVAAISSGGAAPVLARKLKTELEGLLPPQIGRLAALARQLRGEVLARLPDAAARRHFWQDFVEGSVADLVLAGREAEGRRAAGEALERAVDGASHSRMGEVALVGAGPGAPDLLTLRALRLLQLADVVVYDRLVSNAVLDLARRDAERIYAGKARGRHTLPQEDINALLARLAREGRRVVRLKGGDPFIFGRGGEEIETLATQGIPFQVVPGVTAAAGCAAYAGIPLTHRDYAQSCVFVTGHLKDGQVNLDWESVVRPNQTLVVYMGLVGLAGICSELIRRGLPATTPAALVEQGTTDAQRVHVGSLQTLPHTVEREKPRAPTLIIVGEVVRLRERLEWYNPAAQGERAFETDTRAQPASGARPV
jgi:uroporphyrin-III C-methyltransferase/precorrin-2 dehydrogenase/sirohydrochlorin ferrochelatase